MDSDKVAIKPAFGLNMNPIRIRFLLKSDFLAITVHTVLVMVQIECGSVQIQHSHVWPMRQVAAAGGLEA